MAWGYGHRCFLGALGVAVLATVLFAAWMGWGVGGERSVRYVSDLATPLAALTAALLCFRAGLRQQGRLRRFWWLLAAACCSWMLGEMVWAVYDLAPDGEVRVPSWADVGYLSAIPLAVGALLSHPAMRWSAARTARSVLDALAIATALLFLSWTVVLGPLWRSTDPTTLGGLVALAYPFGDVVVVFFIVLAVRGMAGEARMALWFLLGGLLAMALSDGAYAYLVEVKGYETGNLRDTGWFAGYVAIALGALCSQTRGAATRSADAAPALLALVAPFLPLLLALSVAAVQIDLGHRPDEVALIMAFALIAFVPVRQVLLLVELVSADGEQDVNAVKRLVQAALGRAIPTESGSPPSRPPGGSQP